MLLYPHSFFKVYLIKVYFFSVGNVLSFVLWLYVALLVVYVVYMVLFFWYFI